MAANLIFLLKPRPYGDHSKTHGEGGWEEGWGCYVHGTATNQEEECPATNNWTKLQCYSSAKNTHVRIYMYMVQNF